MRNTGGQIIIPPIVSGNELMHQICPDLILASETWEREKIRLPDVLKSN